MGEYYTLVRRGGGGRLTGRPVANGMLLSSARQNWQQDVAVLS